MATTTVNFGTVASHSITNDLGNGLWWQSVKIDNGTVKGIWAEIFVNIVTTTTAAANANGTVDIYLAGSLDGGTDYEGGASGTAGSYTPTNAGGGDMQFIGAMRVDAIDTTAKTYKKRYVINDLPEDFALVVENNSGQAIATGGNNFIEIRIHKYDTA